MRIGGFFLKKNAILRDGILNKSNLWENAQ